MLNLTSSILALNALATLMVGSWVYIAGKRRLQNSIWLVYNILFSLWNFCIYKMFSSTEPSIAIYWLRASFASLIFIIPVFLHFLSVYSNREVFKRRIVGSIYLLFFLIFMAFLFMPNEFVKGVTSSIYFKYMITPGLPFHIFTFIFVGFIFCGFYYLLRSEKLYLQFKRNQRILLFLGMFSGMLAPLSFLLAVYKVIFFPFGVFCIIPYLALVSYIILRYHVFEVNVVANKMVFLSYTTVFVMLLHMLIVYLLYAIIGIEYFRSSIISGCITLLNILFVVHYGGILRLNKFTHNIVYEKRLNYYKFLQDFNSISKKAKDLNTILYYILDCLIDIIGIECASLYLLDEESLEFRMKVYRGIDRKKAKEINRIHGNDSLVDFLREGNVFVSEESKDFNQDYDLEKIRRAFDKVNIKLTVPLYYSLPLYYARDIVGFLNLGSKKNHAVYNKEDIDIINAFGRQIGACLDNAKLCARAIEDDLTKLYRFDYFHRRIEEELNRSEHYKKPFSLLIMDIDDFKNVNDMFGHQVGNEVLKKIAYLIHSNLRGTDIAARYGGEEFGMLLLETDKQGAFAIAERLRKRIEEEFGRVENIKEIIKEGFADMTHFKVTVSIGVSTYSPKIQKEWLIREADQALYKAKRQGKNRVC